MFKDKDIYEVIAADITRNKPANVLQYTKEGKLDGFSTFKRSAKPRKSKSCKCGCGKITPKGKLYCYGSNHNQGAWTRRVEQEVKTYKGKTDYTNIKKLIDRMLSVG